MPDTDSPSPTLRSEDAAFDAGGPEVLAPGEGELILDLEGYEGPLDVLLNLAREQKVDVRRISMVALVDQYLAFIASARRLRLEIAADYLVMAAWLTYLKSRLLLPEPPKDEEPTGEQMAEALQRQLRLLEAMQQAGARLMARPRLGVDTFARGQPEGTLVVRKSRWQVQLYDLLKAYGDIHKPKHGEAYHIAPMEFFSPEEATERLSRMLGIAIDWASIAAFLPPGLSDPMRMRSALAATFAASLQLTKDGVVQLRQTEAFGPIFLRKRAEPRVEDEDAPPRAP
jgi:segregation and condensation protein A